MPRPGSARAITLLVVLAPGLMLSLMLAACGGAAEAPAGVPDVVDFNFHVKPILSDRCFACHGPDEGAREAGLRLDTEAGAFAALESGGHAIVRGRPGRSALVRRISATDPDVQMPPPSSNLTLSDYEIAVLTRWIEQGAEWKKHWSLIPPVAPALPDVAAEQQVRNPIDRFVLARLERDGRSLSPEATRETLLRRVTFDLTGLPPTLDELDAFLADRSPDAYEKAVDRLLASARYGERMAAEWLDVARYADTHGYQDDGLRTVWPYRDWVIGAFNRNMPFDEFVTWQLAGDLLPRPTQEQLLATAFNRNHMQSQEGGIVPEEYRVEYVADRVNTLGRAFMGLTLECARCHDHKYDALSQREYFSLYSFFNTVNENGQIPYAGEPSPTVILKDSVAEARLAALAAEIRPLEAQVDPANARYDAGYAAWLSRLAAGAAVKVSPPAPLARLDLDAIEDGKLANTAAGGRPASVQGDRDRAPETVEGRHGKAQRFNGNSFIDLGPDLAFFERNEPFSVSLWVRLEADSVFGPLFSRSGGYFNGNRGYDCMLRADGTLTASLNHVWPANSIEVETLEGIPARAWHHLVMTYDGSSRAAGIRLYLDGRRLRTRVVTDHLKRSLLHKGDGTNWGGMANLRIGRRFEETLRDASVDAFSVYDRRLTPPEVAALGGAADPLGALAGNGSRTPAQEAALREHYVTRVAPDYGPALAALTRLRGEENEILTGLTEVMAMGEQLRPRPTFVLARGAYDAPTERVEPGTPASVMPFPDDLPKNRLGLARWLLRPDHPLTARVAVNRYWALFFGRGLVATVDDFGNQGELPTHPELLDYLATAFVAGGWDVKALHKLIVTSAAYRQRSEADSVLRAADPDNLLLARGPSYRLPAEMIRDNALAVSGLLVRKLGGPSVKPYQPEGLWEELATRNATTYEQDHGEGLYRRSLYTIWKRTSPPPAMILLDAAERLFCSVRRQRTSTPLQALLLMNDPQYVEAARLIAERMIREGGAALDGRLTHAFRLLTSRAPRPDELPLLRALYEEERAAFAADRAAALDLLATGEYPRDETLDPEETAALTVVASMLMNYDEVVMKR